MESLLCARHLARSHSDVGLTFFALGKLHKERSAACEGLRRRGTSQNMSLGCVVSPRWETAQGGLARHWAFVT